MSMRIAERVSMLRPVLLISTVVLGGCTTVPESPSAGIKSLGNDLFSISQRATPFGSPADRAANFCASFGQTMKIEGNSTEQTVWSDQVYSVLIFRCADTPNTD